MIEISHTFQIPEDMLEESFTRASGPGGQNVNKVETRVQIRFNLYAHYRITAEIFDRLKKNAGHLITDEGIFIVSSDRFRSQAMNREDAREKLAQHIRDALVPPKKRRATRPSKAAKARRTDQKKKRGQLKKSRGRVELS